jgi:hypothetical protein
MGTPPQPPPPPQGAGYQPQNQGTPGIAIAGFVVGLIGLLISWIPFVVIIPIIGLVLSIMGMREADRRGASKGLAIAGLVCSILGIIIGLIVTGVFIWAEDELSDLSDELEDLETTTTFDFSTVVVGLLMLRNRFLAPIRRRGE